MVEETLMDNNTLEAVRLLVGLTRELALEEQFSGRDILLHALVRLLERTKV